MDSKPYDPLARDDEPLAPRPGDHDTGLNARDDPEWWARRNERRRARYNEDPAYKEATRARSREGYRAKASGGQTPFDPRQNLAKLAEFGKVREVRMPSGQMVRRAVMTKGETAQVFGKSAKLFYQWISEGRFPDAALTAIDYPSTRDYAKAKGVKVPQQTKVYTIEEVRAAVEALGPHLSQIIYYRQDHREERQMLFERVNKARQTLGFAPWMMAKEPEEPAQ